MVRAWRSVSAVMGGGVVEGARVCRVRGRRGKGQSRRPLRLPRLRRMAWPSPFSRTPDAADLGRRLHKLDRVFSIEKIRAEGMGADEVIAYYEECSPAYRKHHSREGSMHLAISPGAFRSGGFSGRLE